MNRKKLIATFISAMLTLSGVPVYGTEFSGISDGGEAQTEETEVRKELQTDESNSDIDTFQDEAETEPDTEFTDEIPEIFSTSEMPAETELPDGKNVDANGFEYEYLPESDTYYLVKGADIENVMIPYQYNGKVVSGVGEKAFYGYSRVKNVEAENGSDRDINFIHIGKSAFENCENLREVTFWQGAKMESRAFYNCPKLWKYTGVAYSDVAPAGTETQIEEDTFDPDTKMVFKAGDSGIPESVRNFADKYRVFIDIAENASNNLYGHDDGAYYYDTCDEKTVCVDCNDTMPVVQVKPYTETIGRKAFYGCSNVRKVLIPKATKTIETKAFAKCKNMSIIIPSSVTSISEDTFEGASGITVYADKGSYAEKYAKKHGLTYKRTSKSMEVPAPKMKVTYNSKYGDATLSWTPVEYANQYRLYKYDAAAKKYKLIARINQNTTSYKIDSPVGKTAKYKVSVWTTASVYTGEYSKKSSAVTVQGRPEDAYIYSQKKKGKNLTFKWRKAKGAQGYILYRYDEKTRKYKKIKTIKNGNITSYTDKTGKLKKDEDGYRLISYCITKDGTKLYGR